ncbi:golgi apparatus membrane protein TVP23, putative [Hepatocystis sp. ex Piliocolobus tephrosceles]|uniref:Golgi apparatus membrane protein TVP23 homolog n=1 Tax=Piliocolobus tephrosceles TaxID=591936 RepID=A0A8C9GE22_9PRIM|nr:golgi apparatus membrane protein TVP23, putative [Hepatocystis sp. ex Piliocolobus tephrosceles]
MNTNIFTNKQNINRNSVFQTNPNNSMRINTSYDFHNSPFNISDAKSYFEGFMKESKHPHICFAHIFFKLISILTYFIGPFLLRNKITKENDFIITFSITLFLVSLDFYLVKNITGRFLVKMIWWIDANPDYSNKIVYYSLEENTKNNVEEKIFWYALYINFFIWIIQAIQMLLSLQICWFVLCVTCLFLSYYNLFNFRRCSKQKHKIPNMFLNPSNLNFMYDKIFNKN